ncbi:MAG: hypothetical protein ACI37Z_08850 [Candidatus Gastranaerophilaceae bacterium]
MEKFLFKKNKILLMFFVLTCIVFIISCFISNKGLFFDIPWMFQTALNSYDEQVVSKSSLPYIFYYFHSARFFSSVLATLPFNILLPLLKNQSPLFLLNSFYVSYLIVEIILVGLNFYIAKYTKRTDVAIWSLFTFCFLSLPSIIWVVRENNIAFPVWFILLQYFLTNKKLRNIDKIILLGCLVFSFESFEIFAVLGLLLFVFSIIFYRKNFQNKYIKMYIGTMSLVGALYICFKTFVIFPMFYDLSSESSVWIQNTFWSIRHLFEHSAIFFSLGSIFLFVILFNKKFKSYKIVTCSIFVILIVLYLQTKFLQVGRELEYYALMLIFLPVIFLGILSSEAFGILKLNGNRLNKIFSYTLIIGIMSLLWQIKGSVFHYYKIFLPVSSEIKNSNKTVNYISDKYFDDYVLFYGSYSCIIRSVFMQADKPFNKIEKIYIPDTKHTGYNDVDREILYYPEKGVISFVGTEMKVKSKKWDFSDLIEKIKTETLVDFKQVD